MTRQTVAEFVAAQRTKRTDCGLTTRITDDAAYRIIEGLIAGRRSTEAGGGRG